MRLTYKCFILALGLSLGNAGYADSLLSFSVEQQGDILAQAGPAVVTQRDFDAYMTQIPETDHVAFLNSPARVEKALTQLMLVRQYMVEATRTGLLDDPLHQALLLQTASVLTAERMTEQYIDENTLDDYSDQAHEMYLANPERFREPETLDFSHLLVKRDPDDDQIKLMELMLELNERLKDGADLDELIARYSEDPRVEENRGRYEHVEPDQLERSVRRQLERLEPGERSQPFPSALGWHIVRLDARNEGRIPEWDEVRDAATEQARNEHRAKLNDRFRSRLAGSHSMQLPEGAVRELLERYNVDWTRDHETLATED
ncbi:MULTISPECIES: peptidylprolyl isomerase [unclassified Wenzhouxiangella]|uniref:peptidylprolyl isomerase n=1 Tax=unclassified Wenzhouxiangella TaxID=2613841 RepID=UPI000E32772E|nr:MULTISPECIES: peptidylprolyl isomerase [unclassified Wenzhouxiangella]RFF26529.1 peptidylprolyl isomerase [Wenzhouxiangella sp. 15181]RFP67518.1 peptidylprolyl isomerase [Wenzhouxiangella sp. 15190]